MTPLEINRKLSERYGLDLDGQPKYRVVWSTDQVETRVGRFEDFVGDILIRTYSGARECKKYSYCPDRWILESRVATNNPELVSKMSYEPLWIFQDKQGNFLPLSWPAIEIIVQTVINRPEYKPRSEAQDDYEEREDFAKHVKKNLDHINAVADSDELKKVRLGETIYNPKE
jgi:hypothetical protein